MLADKIVSCKSFHSKICGPSVIILNKKMKFVKDGSTYKVDKGKPCVVFHGVSNIDHYLHLYSLMYNLTNSDAHLDLFENLNDKLAESSNVKTVITDVDDSNIKTAVIEEVVFEKAENIIDVDDESAVINELVIEKEALGLVKESERPKILEIPSVIFNKYKCEKKIETKDCVTIGESVKKKNKKNKNKKTTSECVAPEVVNKNSSSKVYDLTQGFTEQEACELLLRVARDELHSKLPTAKQKRDLSCLITRSYIYSDREKCTVDASRRKAAEEMISYFNNKNCDSDWYIEYTQLLKDKIAEGDLDIYTADL
jgi:hypothetical protein